MQGLVERSMRIANEGRLELCDELYAADFVRHTVERGDIVGPAGMKELMIELRACFPDVVATVDDVIAAPDAVVSRWSQTGTQTGPFGDIPPTGRQVQVSGVTISRVAGGKIVEEWVYSNALPVWQQLGYTLTAPAETPAE